MEARLYYTAPPDEAFNELKEKALQIWKSYDDTYGYASKKSNHIKDIKNVKDNFMYIVAMFDQNNQKKLAELLSDKTRREVKLRMVDGGQPKEYNNF